MRGREIRWGIAVDDELIGELWVQVTHPVCHSSLQAEALDAHDRSLNKVPRGTGALPVGWLFRTTVVRGAGEAERLGLRYQHTLVFIRMAPQMRQNHAFRQGR